LVERVALSSNSTTASTASLQADGQEMDFTPEATANHDIAEEQPPIWVASGAVFAVIWSGLTAPAGLPCVCTALVQYKVVAQ
jgi:hypothetical protein